MRVAARHVPPFAVMALIYVLSDRPGLGTGLGAWDLVLRKLAHMVVFGLLWFAWWRVTRGGVWIPVLLTALYAIFDEIHQTYVADRHGTPVDVAIDLVGVALAVAATARFRSGRAAWPTRPGRGSPRS